MTPATTTPTKRPKAKPKRQRKGAAKPSGSAETLSEHSSKATAEPPAATSVIYADDEPIERVDQIKEYPPDKFVDHPANPPERVQADAILELVSSIQDYGQSTAVRARVMDADTLQILSGHRRVAACRMIGRPVRCEVVVCNETQALREVMLGNADRKDLDPVERGELLQTMIDGGIDRAEAGAMFGLQSDSGIKNAIRIASLPESIKALLRDGTIPARNARYLVPFAAAPKALDQFAKDLTDEYGDLLGYFLRNPKAATADLVLIDGELNPKHGGYGRDVTARPIDGSKYRLNHNYEEAKRGFDLTPELRKKLQIVEVPINGKPTEVALNVKLFDTLNEPHLKKRSGYNGTPKKKKPKSQTKTLSAKEQAAADRERKKEANKRLKKAEVCWVQRFLRCYLWHAIPDGHPLIGATLPWLVQYADRDWIRAAMKTMAIKVGSPSWDAIDKPLATAMIKHHDRAISSRVWRVLVWPQAENDWGGSDRVPTEPPASMILNPKTSDQRSFWRSLFDAAHCDLTDAWNQTTAPAMKQHAMFLEYLQLHTVDQLLVLTKQCKLQTTATSKSKLVEALTQHHIRVGMAMPKCLHAKGGK